MASGGIRPKLLWQSSLCKQFLFPLLPSFAFLPILLFLPIPVTPPFSASQETSQNFYFFFSRQIGIFWIIFPLADLSSYFVLLTICIIKWQYNGLDTEKLNETSLWKVRQTDTSAGEVSKNDPLSTWTISGWLQLAQLCCLRLCWNWQTCFCCVTSFCTKSTVSGKNPWW